MSHNRTIALLGVHDSMTQVQKRIIQHSIWVMAKPPASDLHTTQMMLMLLGV